MTGEVVEISVETIALVKSLIGGACLVAMLAFLLNILTADGLPVPPDDNE